MPKIEVAPVSLRLSDLGEGECSARWLMVGRHHVVIRIYTSDHVNECCLWYV